MQKLKYSAYAITINGDYKKINEDNFYLNGHFAQMGKEEEFYVSNSFAICDVFGVCDGVGGLEDGEAASFECVSGLVALEIRLKRSENIDEVIQKTREHFIEFSESIHKRASDKKQKTGTTFAGIITFDNDFFVTNAGDSKVFLVRSGQLNEISHAHIVYEYLSDGKIKKSLGRYLGSDLNYFSYFSAPSKLMEGDIFLICSDGLYDYVESISILDMLSKGNDIEKIAIRLLKHAVKRGSKDNITIMIVKVLAE